MPNKSSFKFFVVIFSFSLGGWSLYNDLFWPVHSHELITLKEMLSPLNLIWSLGNSPSGWINGQNYINAFFDGILLLGTVGYLASGYRNTSLLRFVYSVIFGSNVVQVVYPFLYFALLRPTSNQADAITSGRILTDAECLAIECIWLFAAFIILRYLSRNREVAVTLHDQDGERVGYFIEATRGTRFANYLIDYIVISMVVHKEGFTLSNMQDPVATKIAGLHALMFIITYWAFFVSLEALFGITPSKTLTNTRVVDDESHLPKFKNIAIRSLSRLVPLEQLSFFGSRGFHDKWSDTYVVMEEIAETDEQISTPKA